MLQNNFKRDTELWKWTLRSCNFEKNFNANEKEYEALQDQNAR